MPASRLIAAAVLTVALAAPPAEAQTFEEGFAAYERGDYSTALEIWRPLAERGDTFARFNLGLMYLNGLGVPQDDDEGIRWIRLAAEQGEVLAQFHLGLMYLTGRGVPQDDIRSHMWSNLAAARGSSAARELLAVLNKRMTRKQIAEAQRLAREWWDAHQ